MNRRWLMWCSSIVLGTTAMAAAFGQAPSSLAERIKQLRRDWTADERQRDTIASEQPTPVAQPRAGSVPLPTTPNNGRDGLPQIEPASLMPSRLFGRKDSSSISHANPLANDTSRIVRRSVEPTNVTTQTIARKSPTIAPEASPTMSTARRSPIQRPQIDFDSEAVREELTSTAAVAAPTILDEFGAGLNNEAHDGPSGRKSASVEAKASLSSKAMPLPVTQQPSFSRNAAAAQTPSKAELEPTLAEKDRIGVRYAERSFPMVGTRQSSMVSTRQDDGLEKNPASGRIDVGSGIVNVEAEKAFESAPLTRSMAAPPSLESLPVAPRGALTGEAAEARRESFSRMESEPAVGPGVLVTNQAPAITSDIRGPKQIAIGREATYRVRLQNQGASAAEGVVATVRIPAWAEVVNTDATSGIVRQPVSDDSASSLQWQIARLDTQTAETLSIALIPRASRPLELGISWTHNPVATRTIVEVQEPKLTLAVTGPDEVLFGKPNIYRLTLSNPGTGIAEKVRINLLPLGGDQAAASTFEVGDLAPGATKMTEVELTAREAGKLSIEAIALAEGDLKSAATKELFCRKPALEVDWRGPETQYAGTEATYFFRVRNPGTAAADDVAVRVGLPDGAEFVNASEGHLLDAAKREIAWRVGSLGPGDDCYMEMRCKVSSPGENKLGVTAVTAVGDLSDSKIGVTNVIALADLKLNVSDPTGPVAVGEEAMYEIRVSNRGASAAEEVNVVGLFSAGLEPEAVEGAPYTISDGRVAFRSISKLPAGQEIVFSIRARATESGTHVFRAEVLCNDLEIKLAAEETTRFYDSHTSHGPHSAAQTALGVNYETATR